MSRMANASPAHITGFARRNGAIRRKNQAFSAALQSQPLDFEFLARIDEHREPLLQEIPKERHSQQVLGCAPVMGARRLLADFRPVGRGIIVTPKPRQRHEIDLLVLRQGVDEARELLEDRIVPVIFEDRRISVVGRI